MQKIAQRLLILVLLLTAACAPIDTSTCTTPNLRAWGLLAGPMYSQTISTMKAAAAEQYEPEAYAAVIQDLDAEIAKLQKRREDAAFIATPDCLEPARALLVEALDHSVLSLQGLRDGDMDSFYEHSNTAAKQIMESMDLSREAFGQ